MRSLELYRHPELGYLTHFNEDIKVIYLKPARTAGTSIFRRFLEKRIPGFRTKKNHPKEHAKWARSLTEESLSKYFIFTSVRDPYDRLSSLVKKILMKTDIKDFLTNYERYVSKNLSLRLHALPYSCISYFNSEKQFDFEIRFESLHDDFRELCKIMQIKHKTLPHASKSVHSDYRSHYDEGLIKIVNDIYENDFKFHNYKMVDSFK